MAVNESDIYDQYADTYDPCPGGNVLSVEEVYDNDSAYYYYEYECSFETTSIIYETVNQTRLFYEAYVDETIPLLGYFFPALAIPTILANILAIAVFTRSSMRSATTILLVFLAFTDDLICLTFLPLNIYYYTMKNYQHYVYYDFCVFDYVMNVMHRIFRTTSNWITVVLGTQRLIVVCFPFKAKTFCNIKTSVISAVSCLLFALLLHFPLTVVVDIHRISNVTVGVPNGTSGDPNFTSFGPDGCDRRMSNVFGSERSEWKRSLVIYYLFSGIFSRFLPCILLLVVTIILVYNLNVSREQIKASTANAISSQARRISVLVLMVMVIFITTEMQDAVNFGIYVMELIIYDKPRSILSLEDDTRWLAIGVTLSLIGYNLNFWIYILMSNQFREEVWKTLKTLFNCLACRCLCGRKSTTIQSRPSLSSGTGTTSFKTASV